MNRRWILFWSCALSAVLLTACGLLIPAHLRAVDGKILRLAGSKGNSLVNEGKSLLGQNQLGPAQQILMVARSNNLAGADQLGLAVGNFAMSYPQYLFWGGSTPDLERLFESTTRQRGPMSIVEFLIRLENRELILEYLHTAPNDCVSTLLRFRDATNTVLFPPSRSASGQALDTAIALAGLLVREQQLSPTLTNQITLMAQQANAGGNSGPLEQMLLDFLSLGCRFNWIELATFCRKIENIDTLRNLARLAAKADHQLPVLFSAVVLSGKPESVVSYLDEFSKTGMNDMCKAMGSGAGGLKELLSRQQQLHDQGLRSKIIQYDPFGAFFYWIAEYCWLTPWLALAFKWLLYLAGGFLIASAMHYARRPATILEEPLFVPGFAMAREFLFGLGFLLVILLLSEPFLSQESQKVAFHFRFQLPTMGTVIPAEFSQKHPSIMNQISLLTIILFFVLQALIYTACLVKLAEIRRQNIPARMKLKLLDNEEHLFDAGLYLGFVGTIISLILVSLGITKPSIMAAYSSTSFGIIFVSILKIFNLRPLRRKLILENEANPS